MIVEHFLIKILLIKRRVALRFALVVGDHTVFNFCAENLHSDPGHDLVLIEDMILRVLQRFL